MPWKARKPCKHPGCPKLTEGLYCDEHKPLHPDRPSAAKRGYGSKWQRASKTYLRKHPLCVKCLAKGRFVTATVVDHIVPHRGDHYLMWSDTNWQALCMNLNERVGVNEGVFERFKTEILYDMTGAKNSIQDILTRLAAVEDTLSGVEDALSAIVEVTE